MSQRNKLKRRAQRALSEPTYWAQDFLTVKEVSKLLGRGETWVKTHAEELDGRRFLARDLGLKTPGYVWRFHPRIQS